MTSSPIEPATTTIDLDVPCAGCGYNLRTLPRDGSCSECGKSIDDSWRLYQLHQSELGKLRANGLPWLLAMRGGVTAALLAWILSFVGLLYAIGRNPEPPYGVAAGITWLTPLILVYVISASAAWRLMTPRHRKGAMRVARLLLIIAVASLALLYVNWRFVSFYRRLFDLRDYYASPGLLKVFQAAGQYGVMAWPIVTGGAFGRFVQLSWLARRRGLAIGFGILGTIATLPPAIMASSIALRTGYGLGMPSESWPIVATLVGPTGTSPFVWAMFITFFKEVTPSMNNLGNQFIWVLLMVVGIATAATMLGFALIALRKVLTRAILLSEESEASSPTSPSPHLPP